MVRFKFKCFETGEQECGPGKKQAFAKLQVVTHGSEENEQFFAATPSGTINLQTLNPGLFEVGREYYVDFSARPLHA